jgi:hypothetical protein
MTLGLHRLIRFWDHHIGYSKSDPIKSFVKSLAGLTNTSLVQRVLAYSILRSQFNNLDGVEVLAKREVIWERALKDFDKTSITYVEFGVFRGDSIAYFSENNSDKDSIFLGLDSFEGLPEAWAGNSAGFFTTLGVTPENFDKRTRFIKGFFNETWEILYSEIIGRTNLIVHFDADLYSSTLFALTKIDSLHIRYLAIFDEFSGDEVRALSDYLASHGARVSFLAMQKWRGYPEVVLCQITPIGFGSNL